MNNLNWHEHIGHFKIKRECIPVGCVPPARYRTGGLSNRDPLDRDPLGRDPLDRDPSPWTRTPPSGQRPPGTETPRQRPPSGHVTCVACWNRDPSL